MIGFDLLSITRSIPPDWGQSVTWAWVLRKAYLGQGDRWDVYVNGYNMELNEGPRTEWGNPSSVRYALWQLGLPYEVSIVGSWYNYLQAFALLESYAFEGSRSVSYEGEWTQSFTFQGMKEYALLMAVWSLRMMQLHETVMKINQSGSGGKGGLLASYAARGYIGRPRQA